MRSMFAAGMLAFGTLLGGCAATTTTSKVAVDYNRIFANSRDEVLVDNILRASAREPLQFSTMGTVTGGVRNSGSITIPFANLIGGKDPFGISPSATINEGINPAVTIIPLADKDFTAGILNPVSLDTLNYFFNQGWDPELILTLTVGGLVCDMGDGKKKLVLNRGIASPTYAAFREMFSKAPRLPIQPAGEPQKTKILMSAKDAFAASKDGIGNGRKIVAIEPIADKDGNPTGNVYATLSTAADVQIVGLDATKVCALPGPQDIPRYHDFSGAIPLASSTSAVTTTQTEAAEQWPRLRGRMTKASRPQAKEQPKAYALLRSVESIIYFLGETQRDRWSRVPCGPTDAATDNWPNYTRLRPVQQTLSLLRIQRMCGVSPIPPQFRAFVRTKFDDQFYYVPRAVDVASTDRTLSTLTFLDELIALQTNPSSITSSAPLVTVGTP